MKVVRTVSELRNIAHPTNHLVPTMGALHEGHLSLIRAAAESNNQVVVSIFVNPTQFGPNEDLESYPRNEDRDFEIAREAGARIIFAPTVQEMYPQGTVSIKAGGVATRWEGFHRPGHFDGVATVVAKLFNMVGPRCAHFGLKDYQQCRVIAQLVDEMAFPLSLAFHETVREPDGLAMSSRNRYLSLDERKRAPKLYQQLCIAEQLLRQGHSVAETRDECVQKLAQAGFLIQYFALVDAFTLEPVESLINESRLLVAAYIGSTRLIDNVAVSC